MTTSLEAQSRPGLSAGKLSPSRTRAPVSNLRVSWRADPAGGTSVFRRARFGIVLRGLARLFHRLPAERRLRAGFAVGPPQKPVKNRRSTLSALRAAGEIGRLELRKLSAHLSARVPRSRGSEPPQGGTLPRSSSGNRPEQNEPRCRTRSVRAFSLIEVIGVLAVIMILAMAVTPSLLAVLDKANKDNEALALQQIAAGLQGYITGTNFANGTSYTRAIPGPNGWMSAVAGELGWLVANVSTNVPGNPRTYIPDPLLSIGGGGLPYTQTVAGAASRTITNARVLILSPMNTSPAVTPANFSNVWNSADTAYPNTKIQRVDFTPLFVQLTLNNSSYAPLLPGYYAIDGSPGTTPLLPGPNNNFTAYFLQGTVLTLTNADGSFQNQVLNENCSFFFENGAWHGTFFLSTPGQAHGPLDLEAACEAFMAVGTRQNGVTPAMVTNALISYLSSYMYYATNGSGFQSNNWAGVVNNQVNMAATLKTYLTPN